MGVVEFARSHERDAHHCAHHCRRRFPDQALRRARATAAVTAAGSHQCYFGHFGAAIHLVAQDRFSANAGGRLGPGMLFSNQVLPFDTDAAKRYANLAVAAKANGRGFPTPDGYIAAIAASRGFIVASRDVAPYAAAGVTVINPWVG
jgi:predicted nucleic acid-binding protein